MSREKLFEEELGNYRGKKYFISAILIPHRHDLDEFVVSLYFREFTGKDFKNREIARIDNAGDEPLHLDRLWQEEGKKEWLDWGGNIWDKFSRALDIMDKRWKEFAKEWNKNRSK